MRQFYHRTNDTGEYFVNPVYRRVAGLPVIWVFGMNAGGLTADTWKQALEELYNEGYAFVLVSNSYPESQAVFDTLIQGLNPWLDQLFTGFQSEYHELWNAAQQASRIEDRENARKIANQYIDLLTAKGPEYGSACETIKWPGSFQCHPAGHRFPGRRCKCMGIQAAGLC
jgi:hypothetical protein